MGSGHTRFSEDKENLSGFVKQLRHRVTFVMFIVLFSAGLLTLLALLVLWPNQQRFDFGDINPYGTASGTQTLQGVVENVALKDCLNHEVVTDDISSAYLCTFVDTKISGTAKVVEVKVSASSPVLNNISVGDKIRFLDLSDVSENVANQYIFLDFARSIPIAFLVCVYVFVVVLVARWRGFRALLGLGFSYLVLVYFTLPALFENKNPVLVALVSSIVIMFVVLYFAHGVSVRTSTALLGTLFGLIFAAFLASWATSATNLYSNGDENATALLRIDSSFSISGLLLCGFIISGLGILNDVTITQSSAVWELYELAPETSARRLFSGGMRIGRDHIASTVYTIAFAYAGAALPILLLVYLYQRPLWESLTSGELAEEVVRTLVGSIALVLAIPITTLIAVVVVKTVGNKKFVASKGVLSAEVANVVKLGVGEQVLFRSDLSESKVDETFFARIWNFFRKD